MREAHKEYLTNVVLENSHDPKTLFKAIDLLINNKKKSPLPEHASEKKLADNFSDFFIEKVALIYLNLEQNKSTHEDNSMVEEKKYHTSLNSFNKLSEDDVLKLVQNSKKKSCPLDPLPTWLIVKCESTIVPILTHLINSSIVLSHLPKSLKLAMITPILKKHNLALILKIFRSISNLKFVSKLIERSIVNQLQAHLRENSILQPMQSAYRSGHSTDTALIKF